MELKANERLSPQGFLRIKNFFSSLCLLWSVSLNLTKIKIAKCFRCIANGGKDPSLLKSQHREWAPDGMRLRITDVSFIERALRESIALEKIVDEFLAVCESLDYKNSSDPFANLDSAVEAGDSDAEVDQQSFAGDESPNPAVSPLPVPEVAQEDDPEFYGVPREFLEAKRRQLASAADGALQDAADAATKEQAAVEETVAETVENDAAESEVKADTGENVDNSVTPEGGEVAVEEVVKEGGETGNVRGSDVAATAATATADGAVAGMEGAGEANAVAVAAEEGGGGGGGAQEPAEPAGEGEEKGGEAADGMAAAATDAAGANANASTGGDGELEAGPDGLKIDTAAEPSSNASVGGKSVGSHASGHGSIGGGGKGQGNQDATSPTGLSPGMSLNRSRSQHSVGSAGGGSSVGNDSPVILRDLSQVLLLLCLDLSRDAASAVAMCKQGLCSGAVLMLDKDFKLNPRDHRISTNIELMWNVLESFLDSCKAGGTPPDEVRAKFSQVSALVVDFAAAVKVLQEVLLYVLHEGFRLSDKELRNEALIIMTLLAHFPCAVEQFIDAGAFHMLITYACIEEMGPDSWDEFSTNLAKQRNYATPSDVDFEFKKGLWFVISELLRGDDPRAAEIFASSPLQACLLKYMEFDSSDSQKRSEAGGGGTNSGSGPPGMDGSSFLNISRFDEHHHHHSNPMPAVASGRGGNAVLMSKTANPVTTQGSKRNGASVTANRMNASMPSLQHASGAAAGLNDSMASSVGISGAMGTTAGAGTAQDSSAAGKKSLISLMPLSKLREFQVLAATFLLHNAPRVLHSFEALDGPARVVAVTVRYCQSDVADHKALIFNLLILLQRCLVQSASVRTFLEEHGIMETFLHVYHKSEHDETRAQALGLVGTLCCENGTASVDCQRLFSRMGGVGDLVEPLLHYVRNRPPLAGTKAGVKISVTAEESIPDPFENPYGGEISVVVIAILDCLGKAVAGNRSNEAVFAEMEGVDVLLDLMETSPFALRLQVLRLLSDVSKNRKMVVYMNAWRSAKTLRSAAQILCHCWMDEEARLIGEKRHNGIIRDVWHPLSKEDPVEGEGAVDTEDDLGSVQSPNTVQPYETFGTGDGGSPVASSLTVTKLATAILAGRNATQTNLPVDILSRALERDSRVLIADILESSGVFRIYPDLTDMNAPSAVQQDGGPLRVSMDDWNAQPSAQQDPGQETPLSLDLDGARQPSAFANSSAYSAGSPTAGQGGLAEGTMETMGDGGVVVFASNAVVADLGLTPRDRQIVAMAKKYAALREGEWWQAVRDTAADMSVTPIEADQALMDTRLQLSCEAAARVQAEQVALFEDDQLLKRSEEDEFIDQIITKKNQQIKAEWLKIKGKGGLRR